ncbi:MAG: DUF502 domain-containing protein [Candidatus Absconditabacterales bacterium]|nr:DUF502 domain-containing protein [Candidatus Absconditabacterales bacterium]
MRKKISKWFVAGIFAILPVMIFFWLIKWLITVFFNFVDGIINLLAINLPSHYSPIVLEIIGSLILILLVLVVGYLINHYYIGKKIKYLLNPIIKRTPLLSSLFKITKQVKDGLDKKSSFKKVVLVKFPTEESFSLGFITGDDLELFNETVGVELVSVFIPTTPNPTNGFLVLMKKSSIIETGCPVPLAVSFVMSMGTVGATKKIAESYL